MIDEYIFFISKLRFSSNCTHWYGMRRLGVRRQGEGEGSHDLSGKCGLDPIEFRGLNLPLHLVANLNRLVFKHEFVYYLWRRRTISGSAFSNQI